MAPALAGTPLKLHHSPLCLSEVNSFMKTVIFSADYSPRFSRTEWNLVEKAEGSTCPSTSLSVLNTNAYSELRLHKRDGLYGKKKTKHRSNKNRINDIHITSISRNDSVISSDDGSEHYHCDSTKERWLNVQDPRVREPPWKGRRTFEAIQAWDVLRHDLEFCSWKARQDVLTMKTLHDKVVDVLNPIARDWKSVKTLREELAEPQKRHAKAHEQVHLSESRVSHALQKLSDMESVVNNMLLQDPQEVANRKVAGTTTVASNTPQRTTQGLTVAGPVKKYAPALKNFWYPVAFTDDIKSDTMVPFECFEEPWVLFRGPDGRAGCVRNSCAHRACPLHLGAVKDGRIQCPYHGWEYSTNGTCEKMPSTKPVNVSIQALPCIEHEDMVWIWPGDGVPDAELPSLEAPIGFTTHAQIVMELPVEHGLLMENLLDLAHAPFTHTTTFAKGWPVPSLVRFCTPVTALGGHWDPYPIDMEFRPPCMVRSTIGISKPGKLEGNSTSDCAKHLYQLHVCVPSSRGKTRLLYRLSLDFLPILKHVPYIENLWRYWVLDEDLRLVVGQQDRMVRGANVWNLPVAYDKLGVRYRKWRLSVEHRDSEPLSLD